MTESGVVRRSVVLPAAPDAVWAALTESGPLSAWLGGDVEIDACPGGQIALQEGGRLRRGVIVDLEPLRRLEIRWLPASHRLGFVWGPDDDAAGSAGEVEFRLVALPGGRTTRLTIVERAPAGTPRPSALAVA